MINKTLNILFFSFSILLVSCNSDDKSQNESEKVFQDYKTFVTEVEKDTVILENDLGESWISRTDSLKRVSDAYKLKASGHLEEFEAEHREEINAFDDRLGVAFDERQRKYDEISHRYELRQDMLGMRVSEDDMGSINAGNIAATYKHFVTTLKTNLASYTPKDWELIEGWWNALENRTQALNEAISPADQETIAKQKEIYLQLREQALVQDASESIGLTSS